MPRLVTICASLLFLMTCLVPPAQASSTCAQATGGKCKPTQSEPRPKPKSGTVTHKPGEPKSGSRLKPRDQYTAAQREKIMENAREICRKSFGAPARVYRIDYMTSKVWCESP